MATGQGFPPNHQPTIEVSHLKDWYNDLPRRISTTGELSGESVVDLYFDDTIYNGYFIRLIKIDPSATTGTFNARVSQDNGATFESAASNYSHVRNVFDITGLGVWTPAYSAAATEIDLFTIPSGTFYGVSGIIHIDSPSSDYQGLRWELDRHQFSDQAYYNIGLGRYDGSTGGFNALRLFPDTGTISSGIIELWGYPNV